MADSDAGRQRSAEKERAQRDLDDIATLRDNPVFKRYFVRRVHEELSKRAEKILTDRTLTAQELHEERLRYLVTSELATLMDRDERACRSTLGGS